MNYFLWLILLGLSLKLSCCDSVATNALRDAVVDADILKITEMYQKGGDLYCLDKYDLNSFETAEVYAELFLNEECSRPSAATLALLRSCGEADKNINFDF